MDSHNTPSARAVPMDTSNVQIPIITVWVVMTTLAAVTVCLRFYTRHSVIHVLGVEDWLILVAVVFSAGACVGSVRQTFFGLGRHIWTLTPEIMVQNGIEQFYNFLFHTMSLAFTKLSIIFLYMRIMSHGVERIATYVLLSIVMVCNVWVLIYQFIQCIPLNALWDPSVPGTCFPLAANIAAAVLHIVTDFVIFLFPIPTLLKLMIPKKQKIGLVLVFSLSFFVCLISIIRMVVLKNLDLTDVTYSLAASSCWSAVEINLAVICACLTTLKPLLARLFPKLLGTSMASGYGTTGRSVAVRYGDASRTDGGPLTTTLSSQRKKRYLTVEEHEFAKLDGESIKSEQGFVQSSYQSGMGGETGGGHHGVTRPERLHFHSPV